MDTRITAKDFFLHIGAIAALYVGVVALLNLLFTVINSAFPQVDQYNYYNSSSLSLPVATLIVVFPLFLFLSNLLQKGYAVDPVRKDYAVRKWLIYITLFIAGGVLAGDLITLIYFFLDGRELTIGFLLKVLSVLVVVGSVFGYYIDDLKGRLTGGRRNVWRVVAAVLVVGGIVSGFSVLGTPQSQRMLRYDSQRVSDLQNIQWQIVNYYQQKGGLPGALTDLNDSISGYKAPADPETGESYRYTLIGQSAKAFELCATFNRATPSPNTGIQPSMPYPMGKMDETWDHASGEQCYTRTIDPELYPVRPR
jgi:hypothetical protein